MFPGPSGMAGFGSLPVAGGGQMAPTVKRHSGVRVPIEGASDWALRHITYEGTERYVKPLEYQDELLERALLIDWRQVLGSELEYANNYHQGGNFVLTETDPIEIEQDAPVPVEQQTVPDAGPWHGVAKNLHESLLQMNVFLDNLNVLRQTGYMAALTILDPNQSDPQPELPNHNRAAQWVWKRKALTDASNVLEMSIRRMDQSGIETRDDQELKDRTQFFHELRKMREYWRIRKIGDHITGDLGYKVFGSKFNPREVFDISRRAKPEIYLNSDRSRVDPSHTVNETLCQSILQVTVPRDLARRATLTVSILPDDKTTTNLFTELDDVRFEYMRLDTKKQEQIHWDNALKWAHETLICRTTYKTLCKDAATSHLRRTLIKGDVLVTHLCDDLLIRFELKYFPFEELPAMIPDGDAYLNRVLRTIIVAEQCVRSCRPQVFVSLPLTPLTEQLDFRGPKAFSEKEIEDRRPRPVRYLSKICTVATHYTLVKMVINTLKEIMTEESDPGLTFRFMRCAQTYTIIMCTLTSKYCEHPTTKTHFHIRISEEDVVVQQLPTYDIKCNRTKEDLRWAIRQLVVAHSVAAGITVAKNSWMFQLAHANMNNVDNNGNPAPTVYLYNEGTTRAIYLKFFMDKMPEIYVKKLTSTVNWRDPEPQVGYSAKDSQRTLTWNLAANLWASIQRLHGSGSRFIDNTQNVGCSAEIRNLILRNIAEYQMFAYNTDQAIPFTQINYDRLRGSSLVKKLDSLYSLFRESDCCDSVTI